VQKKHSNCAKDTPLADPSRRDEFLLSLKESLDAAKLVVCPYLIVFSGIPSKKDKP